MTVETVLLAVLGVVAVWLVVDAGRERHRLRVRMARSAERAARRRHERGPGSIPGTLPAPLLPGGRPSPAMSSRADDSWRYWPLTLATTEDDSIGPRF